MPEEFVDMHENEVELSGGIDSGNGWDRRLIRFEENCTIYRDTKTIRGVFTNTIETRTVKSFDDTMLYEQKERVIESNSQQKLTGLGVAGLSIVAAGIGVSIVAACGAFNSSS